MTSQHHSQPQPLVNPVEVIATGLAAGTVSAVLSKFGHLVPPAAVAVFTAMATATCASIYKAYLADREGNLRRDRGLLVLLAALLWFLLRRPEGRQAALRAALITGAMASVIGIGFIVTIQLATQKSLSCLIWNECPAYETQPSIIGDTPSSGSADSDGDGVANGPPPPEGAGDPPPPSPETSFYLDSDNDGIGAGAPVLYMPPPPAKWVQQGGDPDDSNVCIPNSEFCYVE